MTAIEQLHKAEAAAREAVDRIKAIPNAGMTNAEHALAHLLAALDAARGEAVAWGLFVDGRLSGHYESEHEARCAANDVGCEVRHLFTAPPAARDETPIDIGGESVPRWVVEYADALTTYHAERGGGSWAIGGVQSREQAPPAAVPDALLEIGRRLAEDRKRNDHYTADPIYTVQREVRIYGLDADYAERFAWIEDGEVCDSDLSARLERRFNRGWTIPDRYTRVGYCTRWEFVDAYLSYDAAKERVDYERRKHHGKYRTYVESGCRNHEWKALQAWLLATANKENTNG